MKDPVLIIFFSKLYMARKPRKSEAAESSKAASRIPVMKTPLKQTAAQRNAMWERRLAEQNAKHQQKCQELEAEIRQLKELRQRTTNPTTRSQIKKRIVWLTSKIYTVCAYAAPFAIPVYQAYKHVQEQHHDVDRPFPG
jgi:hypothetical protein